MLWFPPWSSPRSYWYSHWFTPFWTFYFGPVVAVVKPLRMVQHQPSRTSRLITFRKSNRIPRECSTLSVDTQHTITIILIACFLLCTFVRIASFTSNRAKVGWSRPPAQSMRFKFCTSWYVLKTLHWFRWLCYYMRLFCLARRVQTTSKLVAFAQVNSRALKVLFISPCWSLHSLSLWICDDSLFGRTLDTPIFVCVCV